MKTSPVHVCLLLLVSVGALVLSACGGSDDVAVSGTTVPADDTPTVTEPLPDDTVVLIWTESGGCAMAGPNCARYEVLADGSVTSYRDGEPDPAASGSVDPVVVSAWVDAFETTDTAELVDRLGPGEMTAAFDGIDFTLDVPFAGFSISSVDKEFDEGEPFFAAAWDLARAAADAAPLEIIFR